MTSTTEQQLDVSLTGKEISDIMKAGESQQAWKENTAKFIHSHVMNKLNSNPTTKKTQTTPDLTEMEIVDEPTQQQCQWLNKLSQIP